MVIQQLNIWKKNDVSNNRVGEKCKEKRRMIFLSQKEEGHDYDIDVRILKDELEKTMPWLHDYISCSLENMEQVENYQNMIPVGTIDFVKKHLKLAHKIEKMNPIEVPQILRNDYFLKREYKIVPYEELPLDGYYFIKDVTELKRFSYIGEISRMKDWEISNQNNFSICLPDKNHMFQVSEVVEILSEYRCFVFQDEVMAIQHYDGDCMVFPDVSVLKKAVNMYMLDRTRPMAYTIDVAVIKDRGTAILEIHPWCSVGLYGYLFGSKLPYAYANGYYYYLTDFN